MHELHAHVIGPGVEVLAHACRDRAGIAPRHGRIDQPVAPADVRELRRLFPGMVKKKVKS